MAMMIIVIIINAGSAASPHQDIGQAGEMGSKQLER